MKKHVNCITINTDASFHPVKKYGGYAFYIVCNNFKIQKAGAFKEKCQSPIDAEMKCMANALHTLMAQKDLPTTSLIVINSDCLFAFEKVGKKSNNEIGRKISKLIRDVRQKMSYKGIVLPNYEFRHVKAHSGVNDARSKVNDWCDKQAKSWMWKAYNENENKITK